MKLYRFDRAVGHEIGKFGSNDFILSTIAHLKGEALVSCMYLGGKGLAGNHQAITPQLILVVQGDGWVRGETGGELEIHPGDAVFWERGERHETGTQTGMTAIIIECELLNPEEFMTTMKPPVQKTPGKGVFTVR